MKHEHTWAEDVNFWMSSKTGPDRWIEKAKAEIRRIGGEIVQSVNACDDRRGYEAFAIRFSIDGESFAIKWPVLKSKKGNHGAARIQAATALYHDVKVAAVRAKFMGTRTAFITWLELPGGQVVGQASSKQLQQVLPRMIAGQVQEGA